MLTFFFFFFFKQKTAYEMRISDWSSDVCSSDLHTMCAEGEIESDTLRYSCGIPAQSLAYKLGDEEIMRMRLQVHEQLRDKFSFRDFHSAVLGCGTLPLPALDRKSTRLNSSH